MKNFYELYKEKLITREAAADKVKSGDTVDLYGYSVGGKALDAALAKRVGELKDVTIRTVIAFHPYWDVQKADPNGISFHFEHIFIEGISRRDVSPTNLSQTPTCLYDIPMAYRRGDYKTDVASFRVSPMDEEGYFHFSYNNNFQNALATSAKCFIAEIDHGLFPMKTVHPEGKVHISDVQYIIDEVKTYAYTEFPDPVPTENDKKIAKLIAGQLTDGCCFQIGIGSVSQAVMQIIPELGLRDLGVHTELFTDGMMELYKSGIINGKYKTIDKGLMVATFIAGKNDIYESARDCEALYIAPCDYTNDPHVIGQIDNFISINSCLEIDLSGQVNSESIGPRPYTGTGGQLDFVQGAYRSKGGKSIISFNSTYRKKDGTIASKIQPALSLGSTVTTPKSVVQYICTEYGIVNLSHQNLWTRAERIISIAHPDFREDLIKEAEKLGVWRASNKR